MFPGGIRDDLHDLHNLPHVFPGLDLYYADPAKPLTTAREVLDDLLKIIVCPRCQLRTQKKTK